MTLTQLAYIVAVDNQRSFGGAARECHVTQPTLSLQVQKLEEELNVVIFDRTRTPVIPTPAGARILEQARRALREASGVEEVARQAQGIIAGEFRVGIIPTVSPYLVPLFFESFAQSYPDVKLVLEELQTQDILERLRRDRLDAGVMATPVPGEDLLEIPLYQEPFWAYVAEGHPLAKKKEIHPQDLKAGDVWLLSEGHCFRNQVLELCAKGKRAPERPTLSFESGNLDTLRKMVERGAGLTLLPHLALADLKDPKQKKLLRRFAAPVPKRQISCVHSRVYLKQALLGAFADTVREALPKELRRANSGYVVDLKLDHGPEK